MKFSYAIPLLLQGAGMCTGVTHRRLDFERIANYQPATLVTDHNAIDKDLHLIKKWLFRGYESYYAAEDVYREGAHSKSVAKLNLKTPLDTEIPAGSEVVGFTKTGGAQVKGRLLETAKANQTVVLVRYDVNEIQANYVNCQVGGSPAPETSGCFNSSGTFNLSDVGQSFEYEYVVKKGNFNYRTIAGFSTEAKKRMWDCDACPLDTYAKFVEYYGEYDYADQIITAAFNGGKTNLKNGNNDFSRYVGGIGRTEVIEKAMPYLNIWMYVIHEMEDAVYDCSNGCTSPEDCADKVPGVHGWDKAVAYYTGSRWGTGPSITNGNLLYQLADKRCMQANTCENGVEGTSYVNSEIFKEFNHGQRNLFAGNCEGARTNKERIETLMSIPLIQGTLRYGHIEAWETNLTERHASQGPAFAMAVIPLVHRCSPEDAEIIHEHMKVRAPADVIHNYQEVREAFERNYECLNITCAQVGGIWDSITQTYKPDALPCGLNQVKDNTLLFAIGIAIGGLVIAALIAVVVLRLGPKESRPKESPPAPHEAETDAFHNEPETDAFQHSEHFC